MAAHILDFFKSSEKFYHMNTSIFLNGFKIEICRWLNVGHDSWTIHKQQESNSYSVCAISLAKEEENAAMCSNSLAKNKWVSLLVSNCYICFSS